MKQKPEFEGLDCWQSAMVLVTEIYKLSKEPLLRTEFEITRQLKRAALSVMNNIAEGHGRYSTKDFIRFLDMSAASANEVRSMIYVLKRLDLIPEQKFEYLCELSDKTRRQTLGLIRYLNKKLAASTQVPKHART